MYTTLYPSGGSGAGGIAKYADFASLPVNAADGDAAVTLDTDTLYIYNAGTMTWIPVGGPNVAFTRTGSQTMAQGDQTASAVFSSSFGTTNYAVVPMWRNTVDADPIYPSIVEITHSATGFTAKFNAPTDSANYIFGYVAILNT